jgi:hypothetical protein
MDGAEVRALMLSRLVAYGIDANVALTSLAGQQRHLHPIAAADYRVERGQWLKLVVGSRYAEHIVSQTLMVRLGGQADERERRIYEALQDATVAYADLYRDGAREREIHEDMLLCFAEIEKRYGLPGFAASATLHHPGGGTSPLGNRDRMLDPAGVRACEAWTQFALNPVDSLAGFKVEVQGVTRPGGASPVLLDTAEFASDILPFRQVRSPAGLTARLPELLTLP